MSDEPSRPVRASPLHGLTVLDFTTLLPGPLATLMLAEAGAEVIKVEPPGGDGMRRLGLGAKADAAMFALLNAGKKSVCVDLKDPAQRRRIDPLLARTDILVEQFRPGVMTRLGLGYEQVRGVNAGVIYCSITGYGQDGPLAQRAGHDLTYLSDTGILALSPGRADAPCLPPVLAADIAAGAYPAFHNILLALIARSQGGEGRHLDVAMTDGLFPFAFWALALGWGEGVWPEPDGCLFNGGSPRYRLYAAQDGGLVAVAAIEEHFWDRFCDTISLPPLARDSRADASAVIAAVSEIIAGQPVAHWREVFSAADCCCSAVGTLAEAVRRPHFAERGLFSARIEAEQGASLPALPLPLSPWFRGTRSGPRRAPALGADNALLGESAPDGDTTA